MLKVLERITDDLVELTEAVRSVQVTAEETTRKLSFLVTVFNPDGTPMIVQTLDLGSTTHWYTELFHPLGGIKIEPIE